MENVTPFLGMTRTYIIQGLTCPYLILKSDVWTLTLHESESAAL